MNPEKPIVFPALMSALETTLLMAPLGILFFYPIAAEYEYPNALYILFACVLWMMATCGVLAFIVLVPATLYLEWKKKGISQKELAGSLATLALALVLIALMVYKGEGLGEQGLRVLFGLLMSIMAGTWTFALRYHRKAKNRNAA
jgi:hypothetical protein